MLQSRWGRRLAALYLLVVAFAGGFLTYHVLFSQRSSVLGILLVIAGMPWSVMIGRAFDPDARSGIILVLSLGIALNTLVFYWLGAGLEYFRARKIHASR